MAGSRWFFSRCGRPLAWVWMEFDKKGLHMCVFFLISIWISYKTEGVSVEWVLPGIPSGDVGASDGPRGEMCRGVSQFGDGVDQTSPWRWVCLADSPLPRGWLLLL